MRCISREEAQQAISELGRCRIQSECTALLRLCGRLGYLQEVRDVHSILARDGGDRETFSGNLLVQMYSRCGSLGDARRAFERIISRNVFSWSIMIAGFVQNGEMPAARELLAVVPKFSVVCCNIALAGYARSGELKRAEEIFHRMPERDVVSWNSMIAAYAEIGDHDEAIQLFLLMDLEGVWMSRVTLLSVLDSFPEMLLSDLHGEIRRRAFETDVVLGTALVRSYGRFGRSQQAKQAFDAIHLRNIVSWNTLAESCCLQAHEIFELLPQWDVVSWTIAITASAHQGRLQCARWCFDLMPERNIVAWNSMLRSYLIAEDAAGALQMFRKMPEQNVVGWTTVIAAHSRSGRSQQALNLFAAMDLEGVEPNRITFLSLIEGFACAESLADARVVLAILVQQNPDPETNTALISMFGRCGSVDEAKQVFDKNILPDAGSWNALTIAFAGNQRSKEALEVLRAMDLEGVKAKRSTLITIFDGCSSLAEAEAIHRSVDPKLEIDDVGVGASLLNMYGKLGSVQAAKRIFDGMPERNLVSWTALIAAYAQNGLGASALELFQTAGLDGIQPDYVMFTKIMVACSHAGLVNQGCHFFTSLAQDYQVPATLEHYNCVIDLFSRTGRSEEARQVALSMPFEPNQVSWVTFLAGCSLNPAS